MTSSPQHLPPDVRALIVRQLADQSIIKDAIEEAVGLLQGATVDPLPAIAAELSQVNQERARLVSAIAAGGQLDGLLTALQAREQRRAELGRRRPRSRHSGVYGRQRRPMCGAS